ncbi:MAG TPA: class I SAM-dependent RNA methyltransferase [Eubacteriales bacterium]|nr:class I SAM-dependent RNA methyltransferase [Eubacteriales bacterium]
MELLIPAAFGVEAVVKRELSRLGYPETKAINGRIGVNGQLSDIAKLNINLSCGERVLISLAEFDAVTFDQVYENAYAYDWQNFLPNNARILTYAKSVDSALFAQKSLCSVLKKAIVDKLTKVYRNTLDESGARYMIEISLYKDKATLTLDTTGDGLHKRGYRKLAYTAPLKETTAAALIDLSVYNPDKYLADLFCGSGTIPIEACLRAINKPVGIDRQFDYNFWNIDNSYDKLAREEGYDNIKRDKKVFISGFDIDKNAVSIARYHAKLAGVEEKIHFQTADMRQFSSKQRYGIVISNPPYGERLNTRKEVEVLYKDLGSLYKKLPDWSFYILTSYPNFERVFGKRADKNRKIYNANIECRYYSILGAKPPKNQEKRFTETDE